MKTQPVTLQNDCFYLVYQKIFKQQIAKDHELLIKFHRYYDHFKPELRISFMKELIENDFLNLHDNKIETDQVAVYFYDNIPVHFGLIVNDYIISKWGKGLIWKHRTLEVPITYGDVIKYSDGKCELSILRNAFDHLI